MSAVAGLFSPAFYGEFRVYLNGKYIEGKFAYL